MMDMMDLPDEEQPMMDAPKMDEKMETKKDGPAPGDYVEDGKWCCCFPLKVGVIVVGILLIIDFIIETYELLDLAQNEYFDPIYAYIYFGLLCVYGGAVVLYFVYLVAPDSPRTRGLTPWSLLIAGITSVLIAVWIVVYIYVLYPRDKVYIPISYGTKQEEGKKYRYGV